MELVSPCTLNSYHGNSPLIRSEPAVSTRQLPPHPLLQVVQTNCVLAETIVLFMINRHGG